ncbi:alpha carbonic anhydrase [Obelidium mucronatum]|nr:alpha carbonic anhydrase [Obelidium mucronatum]
MKTALFTLVTIALTAYATVSPEQSSSVAVARRAPNCLADVIHSRNVERSDLERRAGWSYEGETSDDNWDKFSKTCQAGKYQSPINFEGTNLIVDKKPTLVWESSLTKTPFEFLNNGHTVQLQMKQAIPALVSKQINGIEYTVQQVHFHSPSEHHIEEKYFPLEAHFVHATAEGKLSVIGIFFEIGDENPWIKQFVDNIPQKENTTTKITTMDLSSIISFLKDSTYYSYSGSLTTPPCTESVLWVVASKPLTLSQAQLNKFTKVMPFNARTTQPNKSLNKTENHSTSDYHHKEDTATTTTRKTTRTKSETKYSTTTIIKTESLTSSSYVASTTSTTTSTKAILDKSGSKVFASVSVAALFAVFFCF